MSTLHLILFLLIIIICIYSVQCDDFTYDYVVIGSGSGGVVATRLAEARYYVLLIEAGPDDLTYSNDAFIAGTPMIPFAAHLYGSNLDWDTKTTMPSYWNYNGTILQRRSHVNRAKMLGGCLGHNEHEWTRGSVRDYDFIAQDVNLPDWSFDCVLPYFQKIETYLGENTTIRGNKGPIELIQTKIQPFEYKLQSLFDTAINYGLPYNNHQQGGYSQFGVGFGEANIGKYKNGKLGLFNTTFHRESSSQSYIRDIGIPSGYLTVWYDTTVQRVLFNNEIYNNEPKAIGVEYWNGNILQSVFCKKEVIVSGGVYQSPQLLMLSGIGPITQLNIFNISAIGHVKSHERIGKFGQDHPYIPHVRYRTNVSHLYDLYDLKGINLTTDENMKRPKYGIYNRARIEIFLSSNKYNRLGYDYNDIRIFCKMAVNDEIYDETVHCRIDSAVYSKNLTVELNSLDSRKYPKMYHNYFIDSRDYDNIIWAVYKLREIFAFNKSVFIDEIFPGADVISDEELRKLIFLKSLPSQHALGTVSMGGSDEYAVNSRCSVRGVKGLRVVDVSIWPASINGGTQSLAFMIGEKCAKHIIDDNDSQIYGMRMSDISVNLTTSILTGLALIGFLLIVSCTSCMQIIIHWEIR